VYGVATALEVFHTHATTKEKIHHTRAAGMRIAEFSAGEILRLKDGGWLENLVMETALCRPECETRVTQREERRQAARKCEQRKRELEEQQRLEREHTRRKLEEQRILEERLEIEETIRVERMSAIEKKERMALDKQEIMEATSVEREYEKQKAEQEWGMTFEELKTTFFEMYPRTHYFGQIVPGQCKKRNRVGGCNEVLTGQNTHENEKHETQRHLNDVLCPRRFESDFMYKWKLKNNKRHP
jgi:hypothetical protein